MTENTTSDAGVLIIEYIKANKISRASLARKLGINYASIYRILQLKKMNSHQIEAFSKALKHDFFMDFSNLLPADYHKNINPNLTLETRLAELEAALQQVTFERDVLMKVMKG